jgi:lipopolysaccharide export system permease protein
MTVYGKLTNLIHPVRLPIIWRYLISQYIKVLCLATTAFMAVLFVTKLRQIAHLAALGGDGMHLFVFALYLIPYVLPFTLPIACLISAVLLFQRLSHTHELTAMRACGFSLRLITCPILLAGVTLSLVSFYVTSELATLSRLSGRQMRNEMTSLNPLLLLQNTQLLRLGEIFVDMRTVSTGELAEDVVLAVHQPGLDRISLLIASELEVNQRMLSGNQITLISSLKAEEGFDHLLLENQEQMEIPAAAFTSIIKRAGWNLDADHLKLRLLLVQIRELHKQLVKAKAEGEPDIERLVTDIRKGYTELFKRISISLAVFSFTILGCAFGIQVGRFRRQRGLIAVILLSALFLACYSMTKSYLHQVGIAAALLFAPQAAILLLSIWTLKRITRGVA